MAALTQRQITRLKQQPPKAPTPTRSSEREHNPPAAPRRNTALQPTHPAGPANRRDSHLPKPPPTKPTKHTKHTRHKWTPEEQDYIRRHYRGTLRSRQELASILHVSEYAVAGQVSRMGLCRRSDRTKWSSEEDDQLRELISKHPAPKVATILHRSVNAVINRSKRLNMSRRDRDDWYTLNEVCMILGVDHRWAKRRVANGSLKAKPHHGKAKKGEPTHTHHISRRDLKNFIRRYPEDLNANNLDLITVVDLLSGLLPV